MDDDGRGLASHYVKLFRRRWSLFAAAALLTALVGALALAVYPQRYVSWAAVTYEAQNVPEAFEVEPQGSPEQRMRAVQRRAVTDEALLEIAEELDLSAERGPDFGQAELVELMGGRLDVSPVWNGPLAAASATQVTFRISYAHETPETALAVLDRLVARFASAERELRVARVAVDVGILEEEHARIVRELEAVEAEIARAARANIDRLPERLEANLAEIERRASILHEIDAELVSLENERRLLEFEYAARRATPEISEALQERLDALEAELDEAATLATDDHPRVRALREQIASARARMTAATARDGLAAEGSDGDLSPEIRLLAERSRLLADRRAHLEAQRARTAGRLAYLEESVAAMPDVSIMMRDVERRRDAVQRQLEAMDERLGAAQLRLRLEGDARADQISVLVPPLLPDAPDGPSMAILAVMVALGAVVVGAGAVLARDLLDGTVREIGDLGRLGAVPVLKLPRLDTAGAARRRRRGWLVASLGAASIAAVVVLEGAALAAYGETALHTLAAKVNELYG
ncbi:hypothetical protein [Salinarimonas sp.]|uniref:hypothetical protein n=1 Tax=Salinarimonas sp. TaxID=2766526 RepID=UPI0032D90DDD